MRRLSRLMTCVIGIVQFPNNSLHGVSVGIVGHPYLPGYYGASPP